MTFDLNYLTPNLTSIFPSKSQYSLQERISLTLITEPYESLEILRSDNNITHNIFLFLTILKIHREL